LETKYNEDYQISLNHKNQEESQSRQQLSRIEHSMVENKMATISIVGIFTQVTALQPQQIF